MPRALGTCAALAAALALLVHAARGAEGGVTVVPDRHRLETRLGASVAFRTTIANRAAAASDVLVAHLEILSLDPDVYVDPEDWSQQRTRYLGRIAPGRSRTVAWRIDAISGGRFVAYVTVVGAAPRRQAPAIGEAIRVEVAGRKALDTDGILPLAIGIPAAVGALGLAIRVRRRGLPGRPPPEAERSAVHGP